jgi:hypothetical protein
VVCAFMAMRYHCENIGLRAHIIKTKQRNTNIHTRIHKVTVTGRMLQLTGVVHGDETWKQF